MSERGGFPDVIHRAPLFIVRRERWYSLVGGPTVERVTIRPRRRVSWTDAALRSAIAWARAAGELGDFVFSGSNTVAAMQRVDPSAFIDAKVGK